MAGMTVRPTLAPKWIACCLVRHVDGQSANVPYSLVGPPPAAAAAAAAAIRCLVDANQGRRVVDLKEDQLTLKDWPRQVYSYQTRRWLWWKAAVADFRR
jgi:hypothetical protein